MLLVDAKYGWAAQQHWYDVNGQLLLSARADRQRFYRDEAVTMPHHIEVALMPGQPSQMAFDLDVGSYAINRLTGDAARIVDDAANRRVSVGRHRGPPVSPARRCHPPGTSQRRRSVRLLTCTAAEHAYGPDATALRSSASAALTNYRGYGNPLR